MTTPKGARVLGSKHHDRKKQSKTSQQSQQQGRSSQQGDVQKPTAQPVAYRDIAKADHRAGPKGGDAGF